MALPILPSTTDLRTVTERVNPLIKDYNREDLRVPIYALDTGSATAYAIAPIPGIKLYRVGDIFVFKALNANSGTAPTLNVNSIGAGTITYPDGSALVPGDIAANGFYFVQVTSTTPTFALMTAKGNRLLQTVSTQTGAVATGTTVIPFDDTIPQNTEGDEYMTLAITPKSATSTLIIDVVAGLSSNNNNVTLTAALFKDSVANALAAAPEYVGYGLATGVMVNIEFCHIMVSGSTAAMTFKVRAGSDVASTVTFNGANAGRKFGGVMASSIKIREVLP